MTSCTVLIERTIRTACLAMAAAGVPSPAPALAAQDPGRIVGRVVDASDASLLPGVQVYLTDGSIGTLTDLDGRFLLLNVPAGVHDVVAEMIGFGRKTVTGVEVPAGGTVPLDITMDPQAVALGEITVSVERERGSSAYLLDQRRTSSALMDAVGAVDIGRSPASDAAGVAQRMTGVSVSEGKYVFVRGLGERYSQTSLNGSPLPSPEPEKEVVPLDLFPSGFLESLTTRKSYTADRPADFAGGAVEIATKDFPERFTMKFGLGSSFNSESQFRSDFLTYPGGDLDFLGVDDGTRALPDPVKDMLGGLRGDRVPSDPALRQRLGEAFPVRFGPTTRDTPLNRSAELSVGGSNQLFGREIGMLVAGSYSDHYTIRDREVERKYRTSAFDPDIPGDRRRPNVDYTFTRGTREVALGGLANVAYKPSPSDKLSIRGTFSRTTDDETRRYVGVNREDLGGLVRSDRLRFIARDLLWGQLSGEHETGPGSRLEWRLNGARASRDEPGLREAIYLGAGPSAADPFYLENTGESGRYFYSELTDDDLNTQVDWSFPFSWSDREGAIQVGGAWRARGRDFAARRFNWEFLGGTITDLDSALARGSIVGTARQPGEFAISDIVEPGDQYAAADGRAAGYVQLDLPLSESLEAVLGTRVERYTLDLSSRGQTLRDVEEVDVAPAMTLVWSAGERTKVRAAASRTVDRPEFREIAPFQFTEATSLRQVFGNPDLGSATIRSADLRWDFFPGLGELVSAGVFYKQLDDPIEQVFVAAASSAYSFQNAGRGRIVGLELDVRLALDRVGEPLAGVQAQGNLSLIDSEVEVRQTGAFIPTNRARPLEGQAPYVLNAGLGYTSPDGRYEAGIYYNRLGERLTAAGGSGIPDVYLQPRNQLDLTFRTALPAGATLKLEGSNLLGAPFRYEQSANGITVVQREYWTGRTLSVGLSWDIRP